MQIAQTLNKFIVMVEFQGNYHFPVIDTVITTDLIEEVEDWYRNHYSFIESIEIQQLDPTQEEIEYFEYKQRMEMEDNMRQQGFIPISELTFDDWN